LNAGVTEIAALQYSTKVNHGEVIMKLNTRSWLAGVALSTFASMACAIPIDISSGSAGFVNTPPAGPFTDIYTFTLPVTTTLSGIVSSVVSGGQDVDFTSLVLTGPSGPFSFSLVNPDPFEIWTISTPTLLAGAYTLTLIGTNSAAIGTYTGNIAVSAVPEAETYALMLAGLGVIGFLALRRRHSK
jgi:hypothetical protein